jgi:hypothetical protein
MMGRGRVWLWVVAVQALTPACATSTPAEGLDGPCTRTTDCQGGLICGLQGFCTTPDASDDDSPLGAPGDGGDAGDSGLSDAGRID